MYALMTKDRTICNYLCMCNNNYSNYRTPAEILQATADYAIVLASLFIILSLQLHD